MINPLISSPRLAVLAGALFAGLCVQGATILQGPSADYVAFEADLNATRIAGTPKTWVGTNDASASLGTA